MLTYYSRTRKDSELQTLHEPKTGSWIYADAPTEEEIKYLSDEFGFDEGHLRDANDFHEVPRVELEDGVMYFFTRFPFIQNEEIVTAPFLIALSEDKLLTVTLATPPFMEQFLIGKIEFFTTQKTKLFLQLLDQMNKLYSKHVNDIRRNVTKTRVNIRRIRNRDIVQFVAYESTLNDFLSALLPTNTALLTVLSGRQLKLYEEDVEIVEDIQLSTGQLIESCKSNLKTIQNIRSAYATIITNSLNDVIKFLTALTIILTIPTVISSLYGMNVPLPFSQSPLAFFGIIFVTILCMSVVAYIFARQDWV